MHAKHGYALLWDAHSIPSVVPRLFDGELPELNVGTDDGRSCAPSIEATVVEAVNAGTYSTAVNARFKGGYITRHYGRPGEGVHAIQLEIAQRAYMDEATTVFDAAKAHGLRALLRQLLRAFHDAAR
jgi:N-formylglutamate amidohydrolase